MQTLLALMIVTICLYFAYTDDRLNTIASSTRKQESILYSCFINNGETEVIIHNDKPVHFRAKQNIQTLHEGISLAISTFSCHKYAHLNFTFSLRLFQNLYHNDGGIKIYKNGQIQEKPNFVKNYRSYIGDVAVFEYEDKSATPQNVKNGKVSLTFLGDIAIFDDENADQHKELYKCQSFSAQIWTKDILYEIQPIPGSKSLSDTCDTMTLSAIPINKTGDFFASHSFINELIRNNHNDHERISKDNRRDLLYTGKIKRIDCGNDWTSQWHHHYKVKVGLVIDREFYETFESSDDILMEYISIIFANTNGLFEPQLNIHVSIGDVFISPNVPKYDLSTEFWTDCSLQTSQYTLIKEWNGAHWDSGYENCTNDGYTNADLGTCPYIDKHAAWILLSKCFFGSGSAGLNRLCQRSRTSAANVNYEREETWLVFAHELGHLFGANHDFSNGGIMDYGDHTHQGIVQFANSADICNGIKNSQRTTTSYKPDCWDVYDYNSVEYKWMQSGNYSECEPACAEYQFAAEIVVCMKRIFNDTTNLTVSTIVNDVDCDLNLKPMGKWIPCPSNHWVACNASDCSNDGIWDFNATSDNNEECDSVLMDSDEVTNNCCSSNCQRSTSDTCKGLKKQIDAAFTDSNGKLYLFQGLQYSVYSDLSDGASIGLPDNGYPKSIATSFPIDSWSGDFSAAFCTSDDIVYIFRNFQYLKMDISAYGIATGSAQFEGPYNIVVESLDFEFGYIPIEFLHCGRIDAAYIHSNDQAVIICDSFYYTWTISGIGYENIYRPFWQDYHDINFGSEYIYYHHIDAATYNFNDGSIRFFAGNVYIDYLNNQQTIDGVRTMTAMGYYTTTSATSNTCSSNNTINGDCYDSDYLIVLEFESNSTDSQQWNSSGTNNILYETNGGVFTSSNAVIFDTNSKISLKTDASNYTSITNWKMSLWLHPTINDTANAEQDFFHVINTDDSEIIMKLTNNSNCYNAAHQLTVTVTYQYSSGDEENIFEDTDCALPVNISRWNKITIDAIPTIVVVTVNSTVDMQTTSEFTSTIDLTISISSWYLGTGYIGKMDYFIFQETDGITIIVDEDDDGDDTTTAACVFPFVDNPIQMIALSVVVLAIYTMILWGFYKYYGARVLIDQLARRLNMEQRVYNQINNNNDDGYGMGAGAGQEVEMVMNAPQQVIEERAAGIALGVIEQVMSGNVTPDFGSPFKSPKHKQQKTTFLSPERSFINRQDIDEYDGDQLVSPAKKSPFKLKITGVDDD